MRHTRAVSKDGTAELLRAALPETPDQRRLTQWKLPRDWPIAGASWRHSESEAHYPDWGLRLFRNDPRFRYAPDPLLHHHFPGLQREPERSVSHLIARTDFD